MKMAVLTMLLACAFADATPLEELAARTAVEHGLDPELVAAVIEAESGWNPRALSRKGAMGLMQLMPKTAKMLGVADPFDARESLRGGCRYLAMLLRRFRGDRGLAVAAYNAGPAAVVAAGGIPAFRETRRYVRRVLAKVRPRGIRLAVMPATETAVLRLPEATSALSPAGSVF